MRRTAHALPIERRSYRSTHSAQHSIHYHHDHAKRWHRNYDDVGALLHNQSSANYDNHNLQWIDFDGDGLWGRTNRYRLCSRRPEQFFAEVFCRRAAR